MEAEKLIEAYMENPTREQLINIILKYRGLKASNDINIYNENGLHYVQMLFANHVGDETIPMNGQEKELRKDGIYVSLSRTQQGETILKVVNVNDSEYTLPLTDGADVTVLAQSFMVLRF